MMNRIWFWLCLPLKFKRLYNPLHRLTAREIEIGQEVWREYLATQSEAK